MGGESLKEAEVGLNPTLKSMKGSIIRVNKFCV